MQGLMENVAKSKKRIQGFVAVQRDESTSYEVKGDTFLVENDGQ